MCSVPILASLIPSLLPRDVVSLLPTPKTPDSKHETAQIPQIQNSTVGQPSGQTCPYAAALYPVTSTPVFLRALRSSCSRMSCFLTTLILRYTQMPMMMVMMTVAMVTAVLM